MKNLKSLIAILLIFLTLPMTLGLFGIPQTRDIFSAMPCGWGTRLGFLRELFEETGTIDILVVGTSLLDAAIDTPYLQRELSKRLGRPAIVRTLAIFGRGEDTIYLAAREALTRRPVKLLVISGPHSAVSGDQVHPTAYRLLSWRHDSGLIKAIDWKNKLMLYGEMIIGAPRMLLGALRPNRVNMAECLEREAPWKLGAALNETGFEGAPFLLLDPRPVATAASDLRYTTKSDARWEFGGEFGPYRRFFTSRLGALAREHGTAVAVVHTPEAFERLQTTVHERAYWPIALGGPVAMVGVPGSTLFADLSEKAVQSYYTDLSHLNKNGAMLFTRTIAPALIEEYLKNAR